MSADSDKGKDEEFDRFRDLTQRLLVVSKEDADKERKPTPDPPPKA